MLKNRKKIKNVIVSGAAIAVLMVGAASAYFTSTDTAENTWTVGNVDITLDESAYDEAEAGNITPMEDLAKDPKVENTGDNDAFVFVEVSIPKASVKTADEDGTLIAAKSQELFTYEIDDDWVLVDSDLDGTDVNTYLYAYGTSSACSTLKPEDMTSSVFKDGVITFINIVENEVTGSVVIPVKAYGIQTTNLGDDDVTAPDKVWAILSKQVS